MEVELKNSHASTCDLVNLIYQAPLKPHLWPSILNTIRLLCGADQCTLFFYDNIKPVKSFASAARVNENAIRHYLKDSIEQQAAQINNQLKSLPEGLVVTDTDINHYVGDDYSDIVGQNYMDVFWPNLHFEAGIVLSRGKNGCSGLGLQNFKSSHPLLKENLKLLQELSPHLCQAMRLHQQIAHIGYAKQALTEVLEQASYGLVLLDKSYSVKFANSVAKNYLNKINLYHAPLVQDLSEVKKVGAKITEALPNLQHIMSNQDVVLHDKERHMQFSVFEIDPSEGGNYLLTSQIDKTYYLMIIQDTKSRSQLDLGYLQSAYGITNTEHQLISALINGNAEETQLQKTKPSTVRWHLKNIFLKTNTHSQPELARLMLALCS